MTIAISAANLPYFFIAGNLSITLFLNTAANPKCRFEPIRRTWDVQASVNLCGSVRLWDWVRLGYEAFGVGKRIWWATVGWRDVMNWLEGNGVVRCDRGWLVRDG